MDKFSGIWRGIVRDNDDTTSPNSYSGSLKVYVPQVYGPGIKDDALPWAEPCFPYAGLSEEGGEQKGVGLIAIPPIGACVWVAFEQGDPGRPVWLGCWYKRPDGKSHFPSEAKRAAAATYPDIILFRGPGGSRLRFSGDKQLDLVFAGEEASLTFDKATEKAELRTKAWAINVQSERGLVSAKTGEGDARQSVVLDPVKKEIDLRGGVIRLTADNVEIRCREEFSVTAGLRSDNKTPIARGWDRHG